MSAHMKAIAQAVLRQLGEPFPREELDLDAVRALAMAAQFDHGENARAHADRICSASTHHVEALRNLVSAVRAETADEWDCNSYHPTLIPALCIAEMALSEASASPTKDPLTDQQLARAFMDAGLPVDDQCEHHLAIARAVERAHGIGGKQ